MSSVNDPLNAPLVVRDGFVVPQPTNFINAESNTVNYGTGVIDGKVRTLVIIGDDVYLSSVDEGAHASRLLYNGIRGLIEKYDPTVNFVGHGIVEIGDLDKAIKMGREFDPANPLRLPFGRGEFLDHKLAIDLHIAALYANFDFRSDRHPNGFVSPNYMRPIFFLDSATASGLDATCAITQAAYLKGFTEVIKSWPAILDKRRADDPGLTVLLTTASRSPSAFTSCIAFKGSGFYQGTRLHSVNQKEKFNARIGAAAGLAADDVAILDHTGQNVVEGSGSNFFVITKDGQVITPPFEDNLFPGLTRRFVIDLIQGPVGKLLGLHLEERPISLKELKHLIRGGAEVVFTGSALGVVQLKTLIVPRNMNPGWVGTSASDYEVLDVDKNRLSIGRIIADCYRCFSTADSFQVSYAGRSEAVSEHVSYSLLQEVPTEHSSAVVDKFTKGTGKPIDQQLVSEHVERLPTPLPFRRVVSVDEGRALARKYQKVA